MSQPKTEEAIFCDALELPIEQQAEFIENACDGNNELLASVRALLQLHDTDGEFLATPAIGLATDQVYEQPGDRVGCYELEELIGEGGFWSRLASTTVGANPTQSCAENRQTRNGFRKYCSPV